MKLRYSKKQQRLIVTTGATMLLILNIMLLHSMLIGIPAIAIYTYIFSRLITDIFLTKETLGKLFYGFLLLLTGQIILNTACYYISGVNIGTIVISLLLPFLLFLFTTRSEERATSKKNDLTLKPSNPLTAVIGTVSILMNITLLLILFTNHTTSIMPSPWQAVNYWFFILFVISTGLLILFIWKNKNYQTSILAVSLHLFVMYGIAGILYSLGYGFDAFIHRATEQWILVNGSILPKTPYYIGQYSLVAWMAHLTNLPIFYIDVYLVPILASVSLPLVISTTLKKIWYIPYKIGILLTLFIPFIPFLSFNLTTPHNLVILFTVLIVFTTLGYLKDKITLIIPILLSLASLAIHPLVATPTLIFLVGIIITKKITSSKLSLIFHLLFFTAITLTVPILFLINNFLNNAPLPQFTNSLTQFPLFLELFRCPYWYLTHAPLLYEIIYAWQWLIIPTALTLCVGGFLMIKKKIPAIYLFPLTTIALFLSAWFLRSWIVFPDVVSYEQGDYPMRLLKTSLIFILPFGMYMIHRALKHLNTLAQKQFNHLTIKQLSTQKTAFTFMLVTIISTVIMLSLYFSYPQRNIKSRFPGFNVTASDFEAVEWIYKQETDFSFSPALDMNQSTMTEGVILGLMDGTNLIEKKPHEFDYIVLSNQLVSAAALTKYSFAKYFQTNHGEIFYYAIPTGGDLYRQYGKMLYEGQKRAYMNDAMEIAGVNKAYFVINNYWANANKIIEGAKMSADSWEVIGDGDVWIFVYKK